jgi:hypothetical protein
MPYHFIVIHDTVITLAYRLYSFWLLMNNKKMRKIVITFVMSVHLSAWNNSTPTERILIQLDIWIFFVKSVKKILVSLKSDKNEGYSCDHISLRGGQAKDLSATRYIPCCILILSTFFIHQLMHKWIVLKTILKFTLKLTLRQLRHVSAQSHHHQGAHYSCLLKLQLLK